MVIETFLHGADQPLKALHETVASGDTESLLSLAHALEVSSHNMGAVAFSDVCAKM